MTQPISMHSFVSPADAAQLDRLELVSQRLVNGIISGSHQSIVKGGSSEFSEHRAYSPGDEIRHLDWRVFAKSNRYFVKEYDEETTAHGMLVLDTSGSMNFAGKTKSKLDYAKAACACCARLVLRQRDPIGLAVGTGDLSNMIPARSSANHLQSILHKLYHANAYGEPSFIETLTLLTRQLKQRSQLLLFTDAFFDLSAFEAVIRQLTKRGHQVILFHTLAPEELSFQFEDGTRFVCLERPGLHRNIDPASFAETYQERIQVFLTRLKGICAKTNCAYAPMITDVPEVTALGNYLRTRTRRKKRASVSSH